MTERQPNFDNDEMLIPAIIQHRTTGQILMLGYMNEESWQRTINERRVTFYSRSKNRLWTKGESSGNYLEMVSYQIDCDHDTILIQALPKGPTCHTGTFSCFGEQESKGFIHELERIIDLRKEGPADSYTHSLFRKGINKIAQKVGEEAVELVIEAKDNDDSRFLDESADLLYHLLVLLRHRGMALSDVERVLLERHQKS